MSHPLRALRLLRENPDLLLAGFVVGIVATLLIPLPPFVLDLLLVLNVGLGLVLLVTALYVREPLALSSFPTLLLVATLFRLALNVSSTRLILGTGTAGRVIEAFGRFVVQGSYLVGAVVFLILTVIQFLVVAKGAERVAEVAARFTLDALPGKQLAIDADLRAGGCTQDEGRARRRALERESQLYGALDGAMKFVKGDAVAGLVITAVNVLGGLAAGMVVHDMGAAEAAGTYTLLSIGDGLVSQLPALLTAVAAGLVVTRVGGDERRLAGELAGQLGAEPRSLAVVAAVLGLLGLVPGLPLVPFAVLGAGAAALAWSAARRKRRSSDAPAGGAAAAVDGPSEAPPSDEPLPAAAALVLELGAEVPQALVDALAHRTLPQVRRRLGAELGLPLPGVRLRAGGLPGARFRVLIHEVPEAEGEVPTGPVLELAPEEAGLLGLQGAPVRVGTGAGLRLDEASVARAREAGLEPLSPEDVVAEALSRAAVRRAGELLSLQAAQGLLDALEAAAPTTVREASRRVPVPLITEVLRRLLDEGVSLRHLPRILEPLAALPEGTADGPAAVPGLVERARQGLGRQLAHARSRGAGLEVLILDPLVEDLLREALMQTADGPVLALAPDQQARLIESLRDNTRADPEATLLAPADLRRWLWRLLSTVAPRAAVLAYQELPPDAQVRPVGRIEVAGLEAALLGAAA